MLTLFKHKERQGFTQDRPEIRLFTGSESSLSFMAFSDSSTGEGCTKGTCSPAIATSHTGRTVPSQDMSLPVLDLAVLSTLEDELTAPAIVQGFARDYVGLWDKRITYLSSSVARRDSEAALDAVLSVKNSSAMVGGTRLANLAVKLESILRRGDLATADALMPAVAELGSATVRAIRENYLAQAD